MTQCDRTQCEPPAHFGNVVNQRELRIVGMSRSGNHAIIGWILAQCDGSYCFLNCVEPKTNPFHTARSLGNGLPYRTNLADFDLVREQQGDFSVKDWLLYSYEDCFLGMVNSTAFAEERAHYVGTSAVQQDLLILRDPYNLFASRIQSGFYEGDDDRRLVSLQTAVRIWKQHAREYLQPGRYLRREVVAISYNRWVTERSYRQQLAEQLGLHFTDRDLRRVADVAGGSSFSGLPYADEADQMPVLQRWRHFVDHAEYQQIFADPEVVQLSEQIFGRLHDIEQLL